MNNSYTIQRGSLYAGIAFLTPFVPLFKESSDAGSWPGAISLAYVALAGLLAAMVAIRAYIDGSVERNKKV